MFGVDVDGLRFFTLRIIIVDPFFHHQLQIWYKWYNVQWYKYNFSWSERS